LNAERKAGLLAAVSARALMHLKAMLASADHDGIKPQRSMAALQTSSSTGRTTGTGWPGAMF
jgi:hypothetical protein